MTGSTNVIAVGGVYLVLWPTCVMLGVLRLLLVLLWPVVRPVLDVGAGAVTSSVWTTVTSGPRL